MQIKLVAVELADIELAPLQSEHIQFLQLFRLVLEVLEVPVELLHPSIMVVKEDHHILEHLSQLLVVVMVLDMIIRLVVMTVVLVVVDLLVLVTL